MAREIDELNIITWRKRSVPFEKYFGDTDLTEEQKKKRIELAKELDDLMLFLLAVIALMRDGDYIDRDYIYQQTKDRYMAIVQRHMGIDDYLDDYINQFSTTFLDTTLDEIDEAWYLSSDRAAFIAENESESVWNYDDYRQAVLSGKRWKKWVDIRDRRERKTHREVGGKVIPIDDVFVVGDSLMRYPKDISLAPSAEQIVNCRCTVEYF